MRRLIQPELLDSLPSDDPQSIASRADLRCLNLLMGHASHLTRSFFASPLAHRSGSKPIQVVELGAGDGTLLLRLAQRWSARGVSAEVTLIDRQLIVSRGTRLAFEALRWRVNCVASDAFGWLASSDARADVIVANLFLHHFDDNQLAELLRLASMRTNLFLTCEPRRSAVTLAAAHTLLLLGCNAVTRHDAIVSVRAGFSGLDLSRLWPATDGWELEERSAGPFSHGFSARRHG